MASACSPGGGLEALNDPNLVLDLAGGGKGTRPFYKPDKNNFAPELQLLVGPVQGRQDRDSRRLFDLLRA